jgi:hypothetical protein
MEHWETPAVLSLGHALMTTIGYDLGGDELNETKFIESHRDSAKLVCACYNLMEYWDTLAVLSLGHALMTTIGYDLCVDD